MSTSREAQSMKSLSSPSGTARRWFIRRVGNVVGLLVGVALWFWLSQEKVVPRVELPSFGQIANVAGQNPGIPADIWLTAERALLGFVVGSILGVSVAIAANWSTMIGRAAGPWIQILKPVPALVLVPFMLIWFGDDSTGVEVLVAWGCFFIMVIETEEALKNVPIVERWAARTLGESEWGLRLRVMLPASIPGLFGGLRISMVSAVNLTILGEFSIASGGIGDLIIRGYNFLQTPLLFLGVLLAIGLALVLDWLVRFTRVLFVRWE